ncbi:MAG: chromosome segregation protein SMC [Candidatus Marinimicrobia bacterium]|nr:chromosome segregation protein SMC [Candidatus Neomarinimicrobiota bacterium]
MYISELKMHGFKSFANKEVMKLGQGITTVVGPNGCGKTNIVDAIRWVLGEQKYSVLRSGKMEDVIFNGAEGIKPLGVCEVAMTVHNNAGKLPVEYNDIEIARRVYRSGESEYYLNKTQCRLKDIMELFIDTGMGADAYSVIELKMIEQILSDTADDRRKMFEEAAGIHKYRSQRRSTIRKFEITHADLERIQDIIAEVEQKVHHLELQLKRFKRHATLTETLEVKDKELAYLQVHRFRSLILPLKTRIEEYRHLRESKSSESSAHEQDLMKLRDTYKSQGSELNEFQSIMDEMSQQRESLRNRVLVCTEQGRGALLTIDRLEREKSSNFSKMEHLKQLKLDFDKEITELEPTIDEQLNIYKSQKEKFEVIEKKYRQTVKDLDNVQNERWELQRKIADDRSLYERTKALIVDRSSDINELNDIIKDQKGNSQNDALSLKKLDKEKKALSSELLRSEKLFDSLETKLSDLNSKKVSMSEEQYSVTAMINSLGGQRDFYNELIESKEGFPEGTRFVLENPKLFPGILGTVADMFQVDNSYRDALESGLGDLSHCLIARDRISAMKALDVANKNSAGDLTVIPLKEATELTSDLKRVPSVDNVKARASDLVKTSKELRPLADYLLGGLLVVDDLNLAVESNELSGWNLVDTTGAYSGQNLILKNRQVSEHGHMMGRQEKLDLISSELDSLIKKQQELKKGSISISDLINLSKDELEAQLIEVNNLRKRSSDIAMNIVRGQMMLEQHRDQLEASIVSKKEAELELIQSKKALISLEPGIKKADESLESYGQKVDQANDSMLIARKEKDHFQNLLQEIRIKLIELESRKDQLKFKKTSGEETSEEIKARQGKIKQEISELQLKHDELQSDAEGAEKELETLNAEIHKQRSIVDLKQSVYRETYQNIEELQARISSEQKNREQILEDLKNAEIEATETEQRIKLIEERIRDRYNTNIPEDLVIDSSEEQLDLEIAKMQRSIENIGPVNMAVQDEYHEEVERLETLSTQCDDLLKAEDNLRETIRKIDKVARKRFQETFDLVKTNFENLFKMFFEGGNATLRLLGDPDPLEADISIEAQPPGKRNTSLRLLSSGEKALTAISLLFSIYQVKPSPYCILDEVDAPLDDVNIHKFTRVLGKFCDETQFIIVTHNKLTMEIADYMYGVTQEKKGISKLVSVRFD